MGTRMLAFANCVLLLQVVSGANPDLTGGAIYDEGNVVNNVPQEPTLGFMQKEKPMLEADVTKPEPLSIDDVVESQLPAPPTVMDSSADTRHENEIVDNSIPVASKYFSPSNKRIPSRAYQLETNEIVKIPNTSLNKKVVLNSNSNNNKVEMNYEPKPTETKSFKYNVFDKAVEDAINNLPSPDEAPIVPLIKAFNKKIQNLPNTEDQAKKKLLYNSINLKLAAMAQAEKEQYHAQTEKQSTLDSQVYEKENKDEMAQDKNQNEAIKYYQAQKPQTGKEQYDAQTEKQITSDSQIDEKENKEKFAQDKSQNEASEDDQPCGCEDGCEEEPPQTQPQKEETLSSDQEIQTGDDEKQEKNKKLKILAHIIIRMRSTPRETINQAFPPTPFSPPSREIPVNPFSLQDNPLPNFFVLRASNSLSTSTKPTPSFHLDVNNYPLQQPISGLARERGDRRHDDENSQGIVQSPFFLNKSLDDIEEHSESNDHYLGVLDLKQDHQSMPKEFILMKHLNGIMKEKVAIDSLRESRKRQLPRLFPLPSFEEPSVNPSPKILKLTIISPNAHLPERHLYSIYFPDEHSGQKIKLSRKLFFSQNFREHRQEDPDFEDQLRLRPPFQPLKSFQDMHSEEEKNNGLSSELQKNFHVYRPQEIPWFINNRPMKLVYPNTQLPQPHLPPLYFPDENSGQKIKQSKKFLLSPNFKELQPDDSDYEDELRLPKSFDEVQIEPEDPSDFLNHLPSNGNTHEIPWFIKNIINNLVGGEKGYLQPEPAKTLSLLKQAEDKNPLLLRALLAPYAL